MDVEESGILDTSNVPLNYSLLDLVRGNIWTMSKCQQLLPHLQCWQYDLQVKRSPLTWALPSVCLFYSVWSFCSCVLLNDHKANESTKQLCLLHLQMVQSALVILMHWWFHFFNAPWGVILCGKVHMQLKWEEGTKGANVFLGNTDTTFGPVPICT